VVDRGGFWALRLPLNLESRHDSPVSGDLIATEGEISPRNKVPEEEAAAGICITLRREECEPPNRPKFDVLKLHISGARELCYGTYLWWAGLSIQAAVLRMARVMYVREEPIAHCTALFFPWLQIAEGTMPHALCVLLSQPLLLSSSLQSLE